MVIINCIILIAVFVQDSMMQLVWLTVSFTLDHCVMYTCIIVYGWGWRIGWGVYCQLWIRLLSGWAYPIVSLAGVSCVCVCESFFAHYVCVGVGMIRAPIFHDSGGKSKGCAHPCLAVLKGYTFFLRGKQHSSKDTHTQIQGSAIFF